MDIEGVEVGIDVECILCGGIIPAREMHAENEIDGTPYHFICPE